MAFWIALAVLIVGVVGGLLYAVLRGLSLWRRFKRTSRAFGAETDRIAASTAEIQAHLDRATASQARLGAATDRLAEARARLDVQIAALREAQYTMRRLLWFLPGS